MSWPNGERYLRPLQSLVVPLLLSLVFTFFFSRTGGVLSRLNSSTRRFPRFPPRCLCSLITLGVFSLVYAATDTAFCYALTSLNPSCSACGHSSQDTSHLILYYQDTDSLRRSLFGDSLRPLAQALWSFPASGAPWSFAMLPSLGRGRVINIKGIN